MLCVKNVGEECGKQEQNLVTVWVYIGVANEKNDAVGYIPYNLLCSFFFKSIFYCPGWCGSVD